jgi:hypothetical protein
MTFQVGSAAVLMLAAFPILYLLLRSVRHFHAYVTGKESFKPTEKVWFFIASTALVGFTIGCFLQQPVDCVSAGRLVKDCVADALRPLVE